jgi:type III secretion system YseE family protein
MLTMTDLEERLAGPDGAAVRDLLAQQLADAEQRLRRRLNQMLTREAYTDIRAFADALQAAQETLAAWPIPVATGSRGSPTFPTPRSTPCPIS